MNADEQVTGTLSRRDWNIIMAGLGELPGKAMYETAKKVEAILKEQPE